MKILIMILSALVIVSFAPAPHEHTVYWTRIAVQTGAPLQQECNQDTARTNRLRYAYHSAPITDPIGYPFGWVETWNCAGDEITSAQDFLARVATMQADAAAYRAAHPIGGAP